jgi:ABC-type multidrug transport system fused ATPase/permease subunit
MTEAISSSQSKSGKRWLNLATRILVAVIMLIAVVGFMVNVAGLVGVWYVRAPTRTAVTAVAATLTRELGIVENGLGRVNTQVQDARQTLTRVNDAAAKLGEHIQASSPLVTGLSQRVDNDLAPRIENARTTAIAIHDAVVTVNSVLVVLNRLPGVTVPSLTNELGAVSERAQEAQTAVQDLRVTLADIKAGIVTKAEGAVTQLTARIDTALARMQAIVNKYRAAATHAQTRISSTSNTLLLLIDLLAVSLTLLFAIFAAGLVLLTYVCWQYVRTWRFPSLRIVRTS